MDKGNKISRAAEKVLASKVKRDEYKWPPVCMGLLYQPKRPTKRGEADKS